jgi:hypothetical protein
VTIHMIFLNLFILYNSGVLKKLWSLLLYLNNYSVIVVYHTLTLKRFQQYYFKRVVVNKIILIIVRLLLIDNFDLNLWIHQWNLILIIDNTQTLWVVNFCNILIDRLDLVIMNYQDMSVRIIANWVMRSILHSQLSTIQLS